MQRATVYGLLMALMVAFCIPFCVLAQTNPQFSGVIIGEYSGQSDDLIIPTDTSGFFPIATSSTGFSAAYLAYLHLQIDNKNHNFTYSGTNAIAFYSDTSCSTFVGHASYTDYTDPAQSGVHDVYIDLTGSDPATSTVKCITFPGVFNGYFTGANQTSKGTTGIQIFYELAATFQPFAPGTAAAQIGIATSSSLFSGQNATSTLGNLANQCSQIGNVFAEGLCIAGTFLFSPDPTVLNKYTDLVQKTLPAKFPFSWYYGAQSVIVGLQASSTPNMADVEIDLRSGDLATSTSFGPILPKMTILSSSTVSSLLSPSQLSILLALESAALWVLFSLFIMRDIQHRWLHH